MTPNRTDPALSQTSETLTTILARLDAAYDYPAWHWQPATPPDDVCIGAILVQHTSWTNVEHALDRLRAADVCSLVAIALVTEDDLADLVRPAGTPLTKARRLHALAQLAASHGGLDSLLRLPDAALRALLLATPGVGPETADAILLYAAGRPVFEIDAYTIRLFRRLGLGPESDRYHTWQRWFESSLQRDTETYQRYHALIVLHGKQTCRPRPRCAACCLLDLCPTGQDAQWTFATPPGVAAQHQQEVAP